MKLVRMFSVVIILMSHVAFAIDDPSLAQGPVFEPIADPGPNHKPGPWLHMYKPKKNGKGVLKAIPMIWESKVPLAGLEVFRIEIEGIICAAHIDLNYKGGSAHRVGISFSNDEGEITSLTGDIAIKGQDNRMANTLRLRDNENRGDISCRVEVNP